MRIFAGIYFRCSRYASLSPPHVSDTHYLSLAFSKFHYLYLTKCSLLSLSSRVIPRNYLPWFSTSVDYWFDVTRALIFRYRYLPHGFIAARLLLSAPAGQDIAAFIDYWPALLDMLRPASPLCSTRTSFSAYFSPHVPFTGITTIFIISP